MWETFISWYINNYLGHYVENLNSQQLSLALSKGELELENVPLKKDIFRNWGLPVEVKSGVVGRIKIEFNILKYFRNEPVLITIEDVCLVAGPVNLAELDPLEEEALAHESKMSALDGHEGRWKAQFDLQQQSNSSSYYSSLYVSSMRIGASIVTKVVENLQLNVTNVHIRFEYENEKSHRLGRLVAFGVTLQSLNVQSCDPKWNPLSSSSTNVSDSSFKTLKMSKLGVYCDTKAERLSRLQLEELKIAMCKSLPSHIYVLLPVSAEARVTKNNSTHPLASLTKPRFDVHLTLEKVPLQLSDSQYKYSFRLYKMLRKLDRNCRLRHYRPYHNTFKDNAKEWWIYATQAVLSLRGFKRRKKLKTWEEMLFRARDNCEYVAAYQQHLTEEVLSSDARKLKDRMELELHYDDIVELRQIAMKRIEQMYKSPDYKSNEPPKTTPVIPAIVQPSPSNSSTNESTEIEIKPAASNSGILAWFFPSWSSPAPTIEEQGDSPSSVHDSSSTSLLDRSRSETDFDEAILGEMRAFGRDALLARFNFTLNQGSVLLNKQKGPFLDLNFSGVAVELSLKPRSGSHKFQMRLSSLMLKDSTTKSCILAPHSAPSPYFAKASADPLFNLVYEMKPHKKAGHRVTVSTKPMDLILYPSTWDEVGRFFSARSEEDYLEIPYNGYEAMKQKTKEELQVYWERLVHSRGAEPTGDDGRSSWEIYLDIFAPQITIYGYKTRHNKDRVARAISLGQEPRGQQQRMESKDNWRPSRLLSHQPTTSGKDPKDVSKSQESVVIIDLGRFKFTNLEFEDKIQSPVLPPDDKEPSEEISDDENEEFLTPSTSPAPEMSSETPLSSPRQSVADLTEQLHIGNGSAHHNKGIDSFGGSLEEIHAKFYKKYSLEITDVQVIVCDGKIGKEQSTWKSSNFKGTSFMHLVDRFSINLQLERRLVYSEDPLWPALTLVGTLPKLTFHLNEAKMLTLRSVLSAFSNQQQHQTRLSESFDLAFQSGSGSQTNLPEGERSEYKLNDTTFFGNNTNNHYKGIGKLFVAEFTIHSVSVDLQSRGRNIAELQIVGTKTVLTHREDNTEFSFVIQSLLLADAVQTFGPDFQLLLASHRHVCMDSISGSLRDSEPTSPMSPVSPPSPMPSSMLLRPCAASLEIPSQLHDALVSSLQSKKRKLLSSVGSQTPVMNSDALIAIDVVLASKEEDMAVITVQFNNLDVIANQESMIEIVQFLHTIVPSGSQPLTVQPKNSDSSIIAATSSGRKIQANFEFHRLNVLLLRGVVGKDGTQVARKIATATASNARVNCNLHNSILSVDGSLGGLQVLNLTPEGHRHQRVLSVGQDPLVDSTYNPFGSDDGGVGFPLQPSLNESALSFHYERSGADAEPKISLRMASVIYSHCSLFLFDLKKCINQFQTPLATSLRSAATQIALGFVRQETSSGGYRSPFGSLGSLDHLDLDDTFTESREFGRESRSCVKLDVVLDSPIIVLPRSRESPEVLVAHLGQISIAGCNNFLIEDEFDERLSDGPSSPPGTPKVVLNDGTIRYNVFIQDVSLYSLNLKQRWKMMENFKLTNPSSNVATLMRAQDLYRCDSSAAIPILHNTVIQFNVSYMDETGGGPLGGDTYDGGYQEFNDNPTSSGSRLEIQGRVISALKVSLTPQQYSQLLDSISNVASASESDFGEVNVEERRVHWEKEKLNFKRGSTSAPPLPSPSRSSEENALIILSCFEVPDLIVELVLPEDLSRTQYFEDDPSLCLSCSDLLFKCDRKGYVTEMSISLKALKLEDLNADPDSWKRVLAMSKNAKGLDRSFIHDGRSLSRSRLSGRDSFSTSCPDLRKSNPMTIHTSCSTASNLPSPSKMESSSLPEELDPSEIFKGRYFHSKHSQAPIAPSSTKNRRRSSCKPKPFQSHSDAQEFCPVTPPPSPRPERGGNSENLVQILVKMTDPKSPKFMTDYAGNHKHVDVDFNTLEVLLTPDTFSCLRRFFSDAAAAKVEVDSVTHFPIKSGSSSSLPQDLSAGSSGHHSNSVAFDDRNTETFIKVKALNLKLAKTRGHLAEAEVSNVSCEIKSRGHDYFGVEGRLGSLEIRDTSLYSGLYPVKFAFQGDQALDFDYARTGLDGKFRLTMSSIVVVHTNRFYTEFMSLWSSLFGQHSSSTSSDINATNLPGVDMESEHNTRVMLDIQAGAPVILLPYSSTSETMLVADLGHLSVRNKFVNESGGLVINYITIDLIEMDLYSGELSPNRSSAGSATTLGEKSQRKQWNLHKGWSVMKTQEESSSFLRQQCQLNLKVGRVFEGTLGDSVAATRVQGVLSTVHCTIDPEKYKLIRGLLAHNIGENIGITEDPTISVYQQGPPNISKTSIGRRGSGGSFGHTKIDLNIQLDLVNVTLEVVKQIGERLGRVDFIKSKFTFQSNVDGSKDVDLASQEILICDSRFEDKKNDEDMESSESFNIFTNILQQSVTPPSGSKAASACSSTSSFRSQFPLQAEIHYRMTQRGSNVTLVLNNMRLMVILDWWMEVRDFLIQEIPKPPGVGASLFEADSLLLGRITNASPLLERSRGLSSPVTVSTGIVTRRAPVLDVPESVFELKINISNCELVAVEKAFVWDTNALILKASAALGYRPHLERPISCNILQCELFSCILGLESETALSILDPTNIQIDVVRQTESESKGILDATLSLASSGKILKIQSPNLNLRLSYYDMKMFLRLMDKFSKEAQLHFLKSPNFIETSSPVPSSEVDESSFAPFASFEIDQLVLMGFTREEALQALEETHCLEDALFYLTKTSGRPTQPPKQKLHQSSAERNYSRAKSLSIKSGASLESTHSSEKDLGGGNNATVAVHGIEVKCNCLSLCVIDDCKDSDVPVLEISVQQLELYQNCVENLTTADCVLSGDYYNRSLSGWEPFLEPWKCNIRWKKNLLGQLDDYSPSCEFPSRAPEFEVSVSSRSVMEISVTSTLLNLYNTVSSNWTEDYQLVKNDKRRAPFVPFALKNETGSHLWFCTIISNNEEVFRQQQKGSGGAGYSSDTTSWIEVSHGSVQNFSFEGRGKLRHRNTHQLKTHQLGIKVDGWKEVTPVSVDRVGTYFRVARPEPSLRRYGGYMELPPTRLVLEVGLHGSAQKIVTVRSALMIKNALPDTVELKLENTIVYPSFERAQTGGSMIVQVRPGQLYPIPLHSVWAHMWIRPVIPDNYPLKYLYCSKALLIGSSQDGQSGLRECAPCSPDLPQPYRFCVAVKRNEFPADSDDIIPQNSLPNIVQLMSMSNRANLITLFSPFKLVNLLPHEISYEIKRQNIFGRIAPGKFDCMTNIDTSEPIEIHYQVDNFPQGVTVSVNPKSNSLVQRVKIQDTLKRTLMLTIKILKQDGGVLAIQLICPSWIVNKSGLPLLCKQDGTSGEAAGQFQEHEVGRMVTPLMMSFADQEGSEALTFRVGTGLHKDSKPFWCRSFLCQNGLRVRKLVVSHCNNTPESVYMVGVEIKNGTGRYRDTKLVIVSPRFIVDNRSTFKIQISQRAYATSFFDAKAEKTHLTLPAGCNLPFHWPRLDKDQLLSVRLKEVIGSSWSGGFPVDNVDSFHINIRDADGSCTFLRVEIVLQGPSYFVIFSDTTQLPPPFRIDNFSMVPLVFHQSCLGEERLKITARPESCLPYALDEPTQLAHLAIAAPGGTSVVVNMDDLRYMEQLTYENFFYIGFTATFTADPGHSIGTSGMESLELVLDVEGTKVILKKKEQGNRSQLWRVSADGLIEHEGSRYDLLLYDSAVARVLGFNSGEFFLFSPPRDLKKHQQEGTMLVLDIAGPAPLPTQCVPLMLRKPDRRRISTQHWEFTADGRMKCKLYENLYVQAKDGFGTFGNTGNNTGGSEVGSWQLWSDVVLGPSQPVCYIRTDSGIPAEQAVARQKLRAGSGVLSLGVETDGPTRVLRIIDVEHPPRHQLLHHTFEENDYNTTPKFRMKVELPLGLGISIVACNPHREELLYGRFSGFGLEWTDTKNSQILKASVLTLQIDNQLLESEKSAVIYVPSGSRSDTIDDFTMYQQQPALCLYWESMKSNLNARVFKVWELVAKPISLIIEERLLLKLSMWLGFGQQVQSLDMLQQSDFEVQKALTSTASLNTRRYYFAVLKIILHQVKLSVLTTSKLPAELAALKRRLGLTLIRFEDAIVDLDPFEKHHPFETFEFLWALVVKHYRDELVSQAAVILGSTDFLGNPLGFVNDVSEGVSLMIYEGSVGALVKNVAHGLSNSAAKVTGTLGEGLGKTIMDDKHETERRRIKDDHSGSSGEYLYAGLKGFGHGLLGGVTSVVAQSYEGASNDGITGLFTGLTKGLVGTITKPAVGVLDFATGAASAIRDSSKTSSRMIPPRLRPTRVVIGNGGLLPVYSEMSAYGQELLFDLNDRNFREIFIACETLKSGPNQDLRIMISSDAVTVFRPGKGNPVILKIPLNELVECQIAPSVGDREKTPYIELVRAVPDLPAPNRPQVICEHEQVAKRVVQQVNYAKVLFEEMRHSQIGPISQNDE